MLKYTVSRTAMLALLMAAVTTPALAEDAALTQTVNSLSQQVQDQQKQIDKLLGALQEKKKVRKAVAPQPEPTNVVAQDVQTKPGVVAPLQPVTLGTLRVSEVLNPQTMQQVSQAPAVSVPMGSYQQTVQSNVQPVAITAPVSQPVLAAPRLPQMASAAPQPASVQQPAGVVRTAQAGKPEHVGEAPPAPTKPPEVQALSNVGGVLTPYGKVVVEPFVQYSRSSVNSFVFQGVQVVSSVLIGAVQADRTARDLVSAGATFRVGVSDRMELEARIPYVARQDSITNTVVSAQNQTTTNNANGHGIGDLEVAAHYQINDGREDWPFFVGNLRFKSDTGSSPYNSEFNSDGTSRTLATGSGFMAFEPSITAIYPSDPATLFANLGYIHSLPEDINHAVGNNNIGRVSPGDTYTASLGMGIALNDRLSFTLGYQHDYIRPTETVVAGVAQNSQSLQVGSALTGISFRVNDRTSVNLNLAAGITRDAPDAVLGLRVPITLQAF